MQQTNFDIYGHEPIPWSRALDQLQDDSAKKTTWLAAVRPDGRPHVARVVRDQHRTGRSARHCRSRKYWRRRAP